MSQKKIITATEEFPITPEHIDASQHFFEAFGNRETEISAGWIVSFMQDRGQGWAPFTKQEIEAYYSKEYSDGFRFNRLVEPEMVPPSLARAFAGYADPLVPAGGGWIVLGDDKKYYVTDDFVIRCFKSSPAKKSKKQDVVVGQ